MSDRSRHGGREFVAKLRRLLAELPPLESIAEFQLNASARQYLLEAADLLREYSAAADPVREPEIVFDPSDPRRLGELIARAMLVQDRVPLQATGRFYGSGVYAIYYNGALPVYAPIAKLEHPIYVGKADPSSPSALSPRQQGEKLSGRLREHARTIRSASNLDIDDFECRYLVVKSAWEKPAEDYLVAHFLPVWNKESGVCHGFGKHGDSAATRANKRSHWDTIHPGRKWARGGGDLQDQSSSAEILERIAAHFRKHLPPGSQEK